jgi:hypothetical protein
MLFIELTPFIAFRQVHWSDEELRAVQNILIENPESGDVIRGTSGLRKLRCAMSGKGKRGGARVIYYRWVPGSRIYLIFGYLKSEQENLSPLQLKSLARLLKDLNYE